MSVTLPTVGSLNWGDALNSAIQGLSSVIDTHTALLATQPDSAQDPADILGLGNTSSFAAGTTNCGFAFTAPSNGKIFATVSAHMESNTAAESCYLSYEIRTGSTVGSGTVFFAAVTDYGVGVGGAGGVTRICASRRKLITGLTPGTAYNIRTMHVCTGGTYDIFAREIAIEPTKST